MSINGTLLGQMITFLLFSIFTMRYVWPNINEALTKRQKDIADGLAASERGKAELEQAKHLIQQQLNEAKVEASGIVDAAKKQADDIIAAAKEKALDEQQRIAKKAAEEIEQLRKEMQNALRKEVVGIALQGAEKVLARSVNAKDHESMLQDLAREM